MTEIELAWLAGLLEGEGSFLFASPSQYKAAVSINLQMTDRDVVERAAGLMGGAWRSWKDKRNPAWKETYVVHVRGRRAAELMRLLLPHMGKRRTGRILAVLASIEHIPRYKTPDAISAEARRLALDEIGKGRSARSIAREIGVNHETLSRFLRSQGLRGEGRGKRSWIAA